MVLNFNTLRQYSPITQAGSELIILLLQLLGNWDYRPAPGLFSFLQIHVIQIGLKLHIQLRMALNFCMLDVPSCPVYLALVIGSVNHRQAFYQLRHTPQSGGGDSRNNAAMGMPRRKELRRANWTILT